MSQRYCKKKKLSDVKINMTKYHLTLQFKYEYEYFTLSQDLQMIMLHLTTIYLYMLIGEEVSLVQNVT